MGGAHSKTRHFDPKPGEISLRDLLFLHAKLHTEILMKCGRDLPHNYCKTCGALSK